MAAPSIRARHRKRNFLEEVILKDFISNEMAAPAKQWKVIATSLASVRVGAEQLDERAVLAEFLQRLGDFRIVAMAR